MSKNGTGENKAGLRVMLCHEVPVMRGGLRAIIDGEADLEVVAQADRLDEAINQIADIMPDVIVTDLSMDSGDGLDAMRTVKDKAPWLRVLVLGAQESAEFFTLAMRAGADGYLTNDAEPVEVVNAIRCLTNGHNYVNATIVTMLVSNYLCRTRRANVEDPYSDMTGREKEILCLAAGGRTNREIAEILRLNERTIHNLRARLMEKLGFHDRMDLLKYALRRGLVSVGDM